MIQSKELKTKIYSHAHSLILSLSLSLLLSLIVDMRSKEFKISISVGAAESPILLYLCLLRCTALRAGARAVCSCVYFACVLHMFARV